MLQSSGYTGLQAFRSCLYLLDFSISYRKHSGWVSLTYEDFVRFDSKEIVPRDNGNLR
jgi:hypothetical protein